MKRNILTPKYDNHGIFLRQIRSFVCRKGRITTSQLHAIKNYWILFGIDFQLQPVDFSSIFNFHAPIVLEIGFGSGDSLVQTAINNPNKNFLGIEVYQSGIGSCLHLANFYQIKNLKIIYHDAVEVINSMIKDNTLSTVQFFFPDPWSKKRHHKRRILTIYFLEKILKKLIVDGMLHIATDSKEYAYYILEIIKNINGYINISKTNNFVLKPSSRITTKFEKKGCLKGNKIYDLMFYKKSLIC